MQDIILLQVSMLFFLNPMYGAFVFTEVRHTSLNLTLLCMYGDQQDQQ